MKLCDLTLFFNVTISISIKLSIIYINEIKFVFLIYFAATCAT